MIKGYDMENHLRKLQLIEKHALDVFVEICTKYQLRYYLTGGTLLGAVRHKGFIPWDDDIDVVMPRPDYEKFIQVAEDELTPPLYLSNIHNDSSLRWDIIALANSNVHIVSTATNNKQVYDARIDIFPLDGMPDNIILRFIHKIWLLYYESRSKIAQFDDVVNTTRKRSFLSNLLVTVAGLRIFSKDRDYHKYLLKLDHQLQKYEYDKCKIVCNFTGGYGFKESFFRSDNGNGCFLEFEQTLYQCPQNYKNVLTAIYGFDFMIPPPEDDRNKHVAQKIIFDSEVD